MERTLLPVVIGVRFSKVGKSYHFDASQVPDVQVGDSVVVETSRGWQIGTVSELLPTPDQSLESLKPIDRRATPRDLLLSQSWKAKEAEVLGACKKRAHELNLAGMKVIAADYSYDGARLSIMYSSESDDKVELKSLRQDMQRSFSPAQVELRQIGPRDVAKLLGGMGACGLESRCCSQFLCEFNSISIRMAKEQGISLTPSEITGMCGRLRCCLIYEFEQYVDARSRLPKRNKRVMTPDGEGKVVDVVPLRESVVVEFLDGLRKEVSGDLLALIEEGAPLPPRPQAPLVTESEDEFDAPLPVPAAALRPSEPQPRPYDHDRSRRSRQRRQPGERENRPDARPAAGKRPNQGSGKTVNQPPTEAGQASKQQNQPNPHAPKRSPYPKRRGGKKPPTQ